MDIPLALSESFMVLFRGPLFNYPSVRYPRIDCCIVLLEEFEEVLVVDLKNFFQISMPGMMSDVRSQSLLEQDIQASCEKSICIEQKHCDGICAHNSKEFLGETFEINRFVSLKILTSDGKIGWNIAQKQSWPPSTK